GAQYTGFTCPRPASLCNRLDKRFGCPGSRQSADMIDKILYDLFAITAMSDCRVKLHTKARSLCVPDCSHARIMRMADDFILLREFFYVISVAHPNYRLLRYTGKQVGVVIYDQFRPAEFALFRLFY